MAGPRNVRSQISSFQRFCNKAYCLDLIALLTCIPLLLMSQRLKPFKQQILLGDKRIGHPFAVHERVPATPLILFGSIVPLTVIVLLLLILRRSRNTFFAAMIGLGLTIVTTDMLTNLAKNAIGRPRPDLLDRCHPKPFQPTDQWLDAGACAQTNDYLLQDGWRSFPSGHSSFSFAGLGYLAFVIAGQLQVFRPHANYLKFLLMLIPLCLAASVAISRLEDYRHDPYDVTAGSLLGLGMAHLVYRRYFPRFSAADCHEAYLPDSETLVTRQSTRLPDEELGSLADESETVPLREGVV